MRNHPYHSKMQRLAAAVRLMSKEAKQITTLIKRLRELVLDIDKEQQRTRTASDPALTSALAARRKNIVATVEALEDRLSAIQGLIELDRVQVAYRMH
jgi:ABC-type transporter Mla subunit MlaD